MSRPAPPPIAKASPISIPVTDRLNQNCESAISRANAAITARKEGTTPLYSRPEAAIASQKTQIANSVYGPEPSLEFLDDDREACTHQDDENDRTAHRRDLETVGEIGDKRAESAVPD